MPGLLLTYLEHRARQRFWFAKQHSAVVAGGQTGSCVVDGRPRPEQQQQDQQQGLGRGEGACSSADMDSSNTAHVSEPPIDESHDEQLSSQPQAADRLCGAAVAAVKDQAGGSNLALSTSSSSACTPGRTSMEAEAPLTPATQGSQSVAAIKELAAAVAASINHQPPRGRALEGSYMNSSTAAVGYHARRPARMIVGAGNQGTVPVPTLRPLGQNVLYGNRRVNGAGIAGVAVGGGLQSALYVSPVQHHIMSFKFDAPLTASEYRYPGPGVQCKTSCMPAGAAVMIDESLVVALQPCQRVTGVAISLLGPVVRHPLHVRANY